MKKILMIFAAMAAIVSCRKAEEFIQPQAPEVTITAEHLKTVIGNDGAVTWDGDEMISVLFKKGTEEFHIEKYENENEAGLTARFVGTIKSHVKAANGWNDAVYCVCPSASVDDETGAVKHSLPAEQYAHASVDGSFETGLNLSYAPLSLAALEAESQEKAMFDNALSVLRLVPGSDDITSITINASDPLVGDAPMVFEDGRLVIDQDGDWGESSNSVILRPSKGNECFTKGVTYNILVYPGAHTSFSVTLNYKEYGDYTKRLKSAPTFAPAKYYTIGFTSDSELIITQMNNDVENLESSLPSLDELEENVEGLHNQIQSVSLMTEYLDNAVYARYAQMTYSKQKLDLTLDYIVRPESAVDGLIEAFNADPSVVSAVYGYTTVEGFELQNGQLAVNALEAKELPGIGRIVTASVAASWIDDKFYEGQFGASVALQIAAGKSSILSDFAHLVPKSGSAFSGSYLENITAVPGAEIVIPFSFATSSNEFTLAVTGQENVTSARVTYNDASRTGNLFVGISDSNPINSQTVTLTLTTEDETVSNTFTFVDNGARINLSSDGDVDWIGGEVKVTAETSNLGSGGYFSINGAGLSYVNGIFAFDENTGGERTATVTYEVSLGSLRFNKSISVRQKAYNTELSKTYYDDGAELELKAATAGYTPLNIVVLGDGYKKKDLVAGGKFERSARQVLSVLFAVQPYKDFEDRFSVHMVGFESVDEGTDITSQDVYKDTYFNSSFTGGSNTMATSDKAKIAGVVRGMFPNDADFYRTVVILLVNTDLVAGSCDYTDQTTIDRNVVGDGFASFSIATLPANTTNANGLIRHELGGHGFGRLGDEYSQGWYTPEIINQRHDVGFYYNIATDTSYWSKFIDAGYRSDEVQYEQYMEGPLYRSTTKEGIMWDNDGSFNAVSRWAIYDRIRKQTEGYGDYWSDFLIWDQKNR